MSVDTLQIQKNQIRLLLDSQKLLSKCSISEFKAPLYFSTEDLKFENSVELQNKVNLFSDGIKKNLIYTVTLEKPLPVRDIQGALLNYKEEKVHALSKVNLPAEDWEETGRVLYVGSSKGSNFRTRIRNHLGIGSRGVYSLHLTHWLHKIPHSGVVVKTFEVDAPTHTASNINLLEIVEQGFWDELKPMFGKRSGLL